MLFKVQRETILDKQIYIAKLKEEIERLYHCDATHRRTVVVHEMLENGHTWDGSVEMFWLKGCSQASRCYAWAALSQDGNITDTQIVLEIEPVIGAATAVRSVLTAKQ